MHTHVEIRYATQLQYLLCMDHAVYKYSDNKKIKALPTSIKILRSFQMTVLIQLVYTRITQG